MNSDVKAPLRQALEILTGVFIPEEQFGDMVGVYHRSQLPERSATELEDWCEANAHPRWAGGSGTLEAAEVLVRHAVDAGNIPTPEVEIPKPKTVREEYYSEYLKRKRGDRPYPLN